MRKMGFGLIAAALLSLLYWAAVLAVAYSVLAADRSPEAQGGGGGTASDAAAVLFWAAALIVWAVALWLGWRRGHAGRPLTPGELEAARAVFGDAIDWPRVRIVPQGFTPFQPKRTAVSPLGAVHFRPEDWRPDFSARWDDMAWLIHELVHVWQFQTGVPVILRGLWERRYGYGPLDPARPLHRYGIEQQAAIVEDWFRRSCGVAEWRGTGSDDEYRAVIPFLPPVRSEASEAAL